MENESKMQSKKTMIPKYRDWSIVWKFVFNQVAIIFSFILIFYSFSVYRNGQFLQKDLLNNVRNNQEVFETIVGEDSRMMLAESSIISHDDGIMKAFISGDRDELYNEAEPVYLKVKDQTNVSKMSFVDTDGKEFLRMHDKNLFGDQVEAESFKKTMRTNTPVVSLEMGRTVFALGAVYPLNYNGKLVGYVRLSEDAEDLIKILNSKTNSRAFIVSSKGAINEEDFANIRKAGQQRNNWNDMQDYVAVSANIPDYVKNNCISEKTLNNAKDNATILSDFTNDNQSYVCGGFPILDSDSNNSGVVISLIDSSVRRAEESNSNSAVLYMGISLFLISLYFIYLFTHRQIRPFNMISKKISDFAKGNFEGRLLVNSKDEIGNFSESFNKMADDIEKKTKELSNYNQHLINSDKVKSEFISVASHELLTPTSVIEGYLSMILDDKLAKIDKKGTEYLQKVLMSSRRLASLVKELLNVSRIDDGRIVVLWQAFDLNELIGEVIYDFSLKAKEKKISLNYNDPKKKIMVFADQMRLKEVLTNVIGNAVKYTIKGSVNVELASNNEDTNDLITVNVIDTGIGISSDEQKRIFGKFYRASNTASHGISGTGLGLYISKKLIELMGGSASFRSEIDKGSVFSFSVKLASPDQIKNNSKHPEGVGIISLDQSKKTIIQKEK